MPRDCAFCGQPFEAQRSTARYCSKDCRTRKAKGERPRVELVPVEPDRGLVDAVKADLEAMGRADSVIGRRAIELAERIVSPFTTGAAVSSLDKQLGDVMAEAAAGSARSDPVDEFTRRRHAKLGAG